MPPTITFLSDYGVADEFVGVCHAVIARICPTAKVIDISHGVPRHDPRAGALILRDALPFAPAGVHLAIVDPDVGAQRRAVALELPDDQVLVGPDNGLLSLAAERLGGALAAVEISRSPWRLEPVSATFHGRDIFAPVAARIAAGEALADAGEPMDPNSLVTIELPTPERAGDGLVATAVAVDRFGNVRLNVDHGQLAGTGLRMGRTVEIEVDGRTRRAHYALTFSDVGDGELLLYEDATRTLALAINRGHAARRLGVELDDELRLRPA
jgi:S-adenosyl-L-methionine hydrolase (adenosine-forming)